MICKEKIGQINELARYEKKILGIETNYVFHKNADGSYNITVSRGDECGEMSVGEDFIFASKLFALVVQSNTLPENTEDIESDIIMARFLQKNS